MNATLRKEILERDDFTCAYCDTRPKHLYRPNNSARHYLWERPVICVLHVDHILPRSRGGSDHPLNLVTACESCNLSKYNKVAGKIPIAECRGCGAGFRNPTNAWRNRAQGRPFFICPDCDAPLGSA